MGWLAISSVVGVVDVGAISFFCYGEVWSVTCGIRSFFATTMRSTSEMIDGDEDDDEHLLLMIIILLFYVDS